MTKAERYVLDKLGEAFVAFRNLEQLHPHDLAEFTAAIHAAQNILLAREGLRSLKR